MIAKKESIPSTNVRIEVSTEFGLHTLSPSVRSILTQLSPHDGRLLLERISSNSAKLELRIGTNDNIMRQRVRETLEVTDLPLAQAIEVNASSWEQKPYQLEYVSSRLDHEDIALRNRVEIANECAFGPDSKGRRSLLQRAVSKQQIEDTIKFLIATGAVSLTAGPIAANGTDQARFLAKWLTTAFYDTAVLFLQRQPDIDGGNMVSKLRKFIPYALKNDKTFLATGIGGGAVYTGISEMDPNGPANFAYLIGPVMNSVLSSLRSAHNLAKKDGENGILSALRHIPQMYRQNPGHFATDMTAFGLTGIGIGAKLTTGINNPIIDIILNSGLADTGVSLAILLAQYGITEATNRMTQEKAFKKWINDVYGIANEDKSWRDRLGRPTMFGNVFAPSQYMTAGV